MSEMGNKWHEAALSTLPIVNAFFYFYFFAERIFNKPHKSVIGRVNDAANNAAPQN